LSFVPEISIGITAAAADLFFLKNGSNAFNNGRFEAGRCLRKLGGERGSSVKT